MKSSITTVSTINVTVKSTKILPVNLRALASDSSNFSLNMGINTVESAPSPKIRLNKFGSLNATLTASAVAPAPNKLAMNNSLISPKILEIKVKMATVSPERKIVKILMNEIYCSVCKNGPQVNK